jgi:hypothetical protein
MRPQTVIRSCSTMMVANSSERSLPRKGIARSAGSCARARDEFSGRKCAWAAPAYANHHIYARTNQELVCASLATEPCLPTQMGPPWRSGLAGSIPFPSSAGGLSSARVS